MFIPAPNGTTVTLVNGDEKTIIGWWRDDEHPFCPMYVHNGMLVDANTMNDTLNAAENPETE